MENRHMELEFNQVSVYPVVKWDIWALDCPNRGTRDDSGIDLNRALWQLCGDERRR